MVLAMYGYDACPHCRKVRRAIEATGAPVEVRDTLVDPRWRKELVAATGRATVPVLRIEEDDEVRWLPESEDIVAYLYERFGDGKSPPRVDTLAVHRVATMAMWALLGAGLYFVAAQPVLWAAACTIGALRSFHNAVRTGGLLHYGTGSVFVLAVVAITLRATGTADLPWWYIAYGLVALLLVATLVVRLRR